MELRSYVQTDMKFIMCNYSGHWCSFTSKLKCVNFISIALVNYHLTKKLSSQTFNIAMYTIYKVYMFFMQIHT